MDSPLLTVKQFSEKHPAFSVGGLRYMIFHADTNGLRSALRKVGRRVFVHEREFFVWIDQSNSHKG